MLNSTYDVMNVDTLDKTKVNFNGMKMTLDVPANSTGNLDLTLADDHFITGAKLILSGRNIDDEIKFQILSGTTIVNQFIDWFAIDLEKELLYPAKIPGNLTIRVAYKNTGSAVVKVRVNLSLHKVLV